MGNNQSVSSSLVELCNVSDGYSGSALNFSSPSSVKDSSSSTTTGFIEDLSEDFLAQVIHQIMAKDEVLAVIRRSVVEPQRKKAKQVRKSKKGRCTAATLQNSLWGNLMSAIQEEIAEKGSLPQSDLQKTFRLRFRVPYSMFADIVQECVVANVFGTGKRKPKIGVDFKVLTCLRILGRNFVCVEYHSERCQGMCYSTQSLVGIRRDVGF